MHAPLHLNLFLSILHTISTTSVLVGVYLLWYEGYVGFWTHILCLSPFLRLGITWAKSPHFPVGPVFSLFVSVSLLAIDPTISLHCACYSFTSFFHFLLPRGFVDWCSCRVSPLLHQSFTQGFLGPLSLSLPLLGFVGQHSCCASPFHYLIPRVSSAHLLLLYLFYSHGLFTKFFGLPQPNYYISTFYYFSRLLALKLAHWVY